MLSLQKEQQIRELLAKSTLSYRAIAKMAGISRGTVSNIANGRKKQRAVLPEIKPVVGYCAVCERVGFTPCVACAARAANTPEKRRLRVQYDREDEIIIGLVNGEREQWKKLQQQKRQFGELLSRDDKLVMTQ